MKTLTQTQKFPVEVDGVKVLELRISVSAKSEALHLAPSISTDETTLLNYIHTILEEAKNALDGSVRGLIVENTYE